MLILDAKVKVTMELLPSVFGEDESIIFGEPTDVSDCEYRLLYLYF